MRNLVLLFSALILGTTGTMASGIKDDKVALSNAYRDNDSFIFVEDGITFSVYPDGEFDFYIENQVSGRRNGLTFNSGYDYSPYAQYDDYGAVIQVENVPIFYDYYGRVTQIGGVDINYVRNRVHRVGGMYVYYNHRGFYDYHTGYINNYNRYYTFSPFHAYFARPALGFCLVFNSPYRRYYTPFRYTYYSPYRYNQRRAYATIGKEHRYNKVRNERASVYRNDKRVAVRDDLRGTQNARSNRTVSRSDGKQYRSANSSRRESAVRSNNVDRNNSAVRSSRSNTKIAGRTAVDRSPRVESRGVSRGEARPTVKRSETKRSNSVQAPRQGVSKRSETKRSSSVQAPRQGVSKRSVAQTPNRTVNRSSTINRSPERSKSQRSVNTAPSKRQSTSVRSASPRGSVGKSATRSSSRSKGSATVRSRSSVKQ